MTVRAFLAVLAIFSTACSNSSSGPASPGDAGSEGSAPPPDTTYVDDAGLEHHADGGLTNKGCLDLAGLVGDAKVNAKSCANVPGVCQATVKDECGCGVFVEDPSNDYAKSFGALAAQYFNEPGCDHKCSTCPNTADGGVCEPQAKGPPQCVP